MAEPVSVRAMFDGKSVDLMIESDLRTVIHHLLFDAEAQRQEHARQLDALRDRRNLCWFCRLMGRRT